MRLAAHRVLLVRRAAHALAYVSGTANTPTTCALHPFGAAVILAASRSHKSLAGMILGGSLHLRDFLVHAELLAGPQQGHSRAVDRVLELVGHLDASQVLHHIAGGIRDLRSRNSSGFIWVRKDMAKREPRN